MNTEKSKTVYTSGQLVKFTETLGDQGVQSDGFQVGIQEGLFADLAEYLGKHERLLRVDRDKLREALYLDPPVFMVTVGNLTMAERFSRANFTSVDPRITTLNPNTGFGKADSRMRFFEFDYPELRGEVFSSVLPDHLVSRIRSNLDGKHHRLATFVEFIAFTQHFRSLHDRSSLLYLDETFSETIGGPTLVIALNRVGADGVELRLERAHQAMRAEREGERFRVLAVRC